MYVSGIILRYLQYAAMQSKRFMGRGQVGKALVSGTRDRRFESYRPSHA